MDLGTNTELRRNLHQGSKFIIREHEFNCFIAPTQRIHIWFFLGQRRTTKRKGRGVPYGRAKLGTRFKRKPDLSKANPVLFKPFNTHRFCNGDETAKWIDETPIIHGSPSPPREVGCQSNGDESKCIQLRRSADSAQKILATPSGAA